MVWWSLLATKVSSLRDLNCYDIFCGRIEFIIIFVAPSEQNLCSTMLNLPLFAPAERHLCRFILIRLLENCHTATLLLSRCIPSKSLLSIFRLVLLIGCQEMLMK